MIFIFSYFFVAKKAEFHFKQDWNCDLMECVDALLISPLSAVVLTLQLTPVGTTIFKMGGLAADMDINGGIYSFNIEVKYYFE